MNMIRRLRRNFILIASAAVVLLVCIVLVTVNATNYKRTMSDINSDLQYITAHGGMLPKKAAPTESGWFGGNERENNRDEFSYQTRYLTVLADKDGNVKDINIKIYYNSNESIVPFIDKLKEDTIKIIKEHYNELLNS